MRLALDQTEDISANRALAHGLEQSALPGTAPQTELESLTDARELTSQEPHEHAGHLRIEPALTGDHEGLVRIDARSPSGQGAVLDRAEAPQIGDGPAKDSGSTGFDLRGDHHAVLTAAGEVNPSAEFPFDIGHQFEALLNAQIVVLEGAEQVWSELFPNLGTEQPAEYAVDAVKEAAAHALSGLEQALTVLDHLASGDDVQSESDVNSHHDMLDLPEVISPYESAFSKIKFDLPPGDLTAPSHPPEQMQVDQSVDLHRMAEGVPPSDPSNPATADLAPTDPTIPASGAYFIDVTAAIWPGLSSGMELLQALHAGQEHYG